MANLKLKLKFNSLEFEIEGEESIVREEFDKFKGFLATEFVHRTAVPLSAGNEGNPVSNQIFLNQDPGSDYPVLQEVVKKDLPNSESEWVLLYAFYASAYGENSFTEEDIKNGYEASKRANISRASNLSNNIKRILSKGYIKMLNESEYIFLDDGRIKAGLIVSGKDSKSAVSKTPKKIAGIKTPKTNSNSKIRDIKPEEFEIYPDKKTSLKDFIDEKKPGSSARERVLVVAYYIKNTLERNSFTEGNIEYAYRSLKLGNKPIHLRQTLTDIKNKSLEIDSIEEGWKINRLGEKFVDEKLPSSNKAK